MSERQKPPVPKPPVPQTPVVEWPTLLLILLCYAVWGGATTVLSALWLPLGIGGVVLAIALHSSLQHEVLHGHPFAGKALNAALVFPALGLWIPYNRFRDTHLAHHLDANLTDPYDDPESNYLDPTAWRKLSSPLRAVLRFNNTLLGRLLIGPLVSEMNFLRADWRLLCKRDAAVRNAWLLHIVGLVPVLVWLTAFGAMPVWAYLLAAYAGFSIIKIRTFLEHRAHEKYRARTVVVEDRGWLAFMFLNNNFHIVHHMHPKMPWYRLPKLYFENRETYLGRNEHYVYRSYGEIFRKHLLRAKDPVPHPLMKD